MLQNITKFRMLIYILLAGLIPILFAFIGFMSKKGDVDALQESLLDLREMALLKEKRQAGNMAVRSHFREADHFYIDKHLETMTFLEPEVAGLEKLLENKNIADDETIRKRLEALTGTGNSLAFSEGVVQSTPYFQETTETLVHPVEINSDDLKKILARVEGLQISSFSPGPNRPQLIILDFKLDRKSITEKYEVFLLNLKLLKREFIQ